MSDNQFLQQQMSKLLKLARHSIESRIEMQPQPSFSQMKDLFGSADFERFSQKQAAFVTLTSEGRLRGCIGSLVAQSPLWESVRENALNAAFHDPRFVPISKDEFPKIRIEVSVLSPMQMMEYKDAADLLKKLKPGEHGVLLEFSNGAGATFLPQVWDELPQKEEFLSHLCLKAGMQPDSWKTQKPRVMVYTVQSAHER